MSEAVARAVGSAGPTVVTIAGKECSVRPLKLKELGEIERECVKQWKRSYLEDFQMGLEFFPGSHDDRSATMLAEIRKITPWDVKNLPAKYVSDPARIPVTEKLESWVRENFTDSFSDKKTDAEKTADESRKDELFVIQSLAARAYDNDLLSEDDFTDLAGAKPRLVRIGYVNWWITGTMAGRLEMVYTCFKHNDGVTRESINAEIGHNEAMMESLAAEIESLTAPQLGN